MKYYEHYCLEMLFIYFTNYILQFATPAKTSEVASPNTKV